MKIEKEEKDQDDLEKFVLSKRTGFYEWERDFYFENELLARV